MDSTKVKHYVEVWTNGLFQRLQVFNDEPSAIKYADIAVNLSPNTKVIRYSKHTWSKS